MQRKPTNDWLKYTRLCSFHEAGRCTRGATCTFAHSDVDLLEQPDLSKTRLCQDFVMNDGHCKMGASCKFAHGEQDVRKIQPCRAGGKTRSETRLFDDSVQPRFGIDQDQTAHGKKAAFEITEEAGKGTNIEAEQEDWWTRIPLLYGFVHFGLHGGDAVSMKDIRRSSSAPPIDVISRHPTRFYKQK